MTTPPTTLIARARELCDCVPRGEWERIGDCVAIYGEEDVRMVNCDGLNPVVELLVAARTLLPDLADALELVTRERDEARAENARLEHSLSDAMEQIEAIQRTNDQRGEGET